MEMQTDFEERTTEYAVVLRLGSLQTLNVSTHIMLSESLVFTL